jgi:hypothetical protein
MGSNPTPLTNSGGVKAEFTRVREAGREAEAEAILERSIFVKELEESFSRGSTSTTAGAGPCGWSASRACW